MRILIATLVVLVPALAFGGESPVSGYISCQSAANRDTIYFSSTWDGTTHNDAVDHAFQAYLAQKYGYAGPIAVSCYNQPSVAAADQRKQATIANLKKNPVTVIDTGWTYKAQ